MGKLVVGPILSESGRYFFRTWSLEQGFQRSAGYDRYDHARHAQRREIQDAPGAAVCDDVPSFQATILPFIPRGEP